LKLADQFPNIAFGGTGYDLKVTLPKEIEACRPDYDLYQFHHLDKRVRGARTKEKHRERVQTLLDMGIGFTTRGCTRSCKFCKVPAKEGKLRSVGSIGDLVNPRSNLVKILDNNFTADPDCLAKLQEIKERGLVVDFTQGIDVRLMNAEIAKALGEIKYCGDFLHYAWDLMPFEARVKEGIATLAKHLKTWRHMCYILVGFDTTFEEDQYRVKELHGLGVRPYVMTYDQSQDLRLRHFQRYVYGSIYKSTPFEEYKPWMRDRDLYFAGA
jgi:hypothetical protein